MTQPGDEPRPADSGQEEPEERDVRRAGGGRTAGETAVDDALGQGE